MLNKVVLIGRLVSDVQVRETQNGITYTYFTLAVNRPGNNNQTDFIDCVAWRGTAEILDKYTSKGSLIAIEGRIEVYKTESNGNYNTRVNVNVSSVTLLDSRRNNEVNASRPSVEPSHTPNEQQVQQTQTQQPQPAQQNAGIQQPSQERQVEERTTQENQEPTFEIDLDSIKF